MGCLATRYPRRGWEMRAPSPPRLGAQRLAVAVQAFRVSPAHVPGCFARCLRLARALSSLSELPSDTERDEWRFLVSLDAFLVETTGQRLNSNACAWWWAFCSARR